MRNLLSGTQETKNTFESHKAKVRNGFLPQGAEASIRVLPTASIWHAVTATFIAVVLAVPIGAGIGTRLWSIYAESLGVKVQPSTTGRNIAIVVASGLVGSVVVAFRSGCRAARRATATTLSAE
jgi:hypothetical protein